MNSDEHKVDDERSITVDLNGQKDDEIVTTGFENDVNANKRYHSESPNKEEPEKKQALADDTLNEELLSTQMNRGHHYTLPAFKTAPQVPICKMCDSCGKRECVMEPSAGFYIAYCEKCDPLSLNATSKCFESACTVNKTWNKLPMDKERIECANLKCNTIKFVCKCSNFHSVDIKDTRYKCETCHECVDPPLH